MNGRSPMKGMALRECPSCAAHSIRPADLLLSDCYCPHCGALVGTHWAASLGCTVLIWAVTLLTTVMVLMQSGLYAALLWLPFPVGSLGYLKARFAPLETKQKGRGA